jgi:hypothetical protein
MSDFSKCNWKNVSHEAEQGSLVLIKATIKIASGSCGMQFIFTLLV